MIAFKRLIFAGIGLWMLGMTPLLAQVQYGEASYYADKYHLSSATASGDLYDKYKFTAAHRTLDFGTILKVTNLTNNRSVTVRVNDRGPYKKGRIVDLSRAAAEQIDLIQAGVAKVKIEVVVKGNEKTSAVSRSSNNNARRAEGVRLNPGKTSTSTGRDLSKLPLRDHTGALVNDPNARTTKTPTSEVRSASDSNPQLVQGVKTIGVYGNTDIDERVRRVMPEYKEITEMDLAERQRAANNNNRRLASVSKGTERSAPATTNNAALQGLSNYTPNVYRMVAIKEKSEGFAVQLGAFYSYYRLMEGLSSINSKGVDNTLVQNGIKNGKPIFRILAGPYPSRAAAEQAKKNFRRKGLNGLTVNINSLN